MLDHLSREDLCRLAELALSELPSARRAALLSQFAPPSPPALEPLAPASPGEAAFSAIQNAVRGISGYIKRHREMVDDWVYGEGARFLNEDMLALQGALNEAVDAAVAWLITQRPSDALRAQVAAARDAIDSLRGWNLGGMEYGDLFDLPIDTLEIWHALTHVPPEAGQIAQLLVTTWPKPTGISVLDAALGEGLAGEVRARLRERAGGGEVAAAWWLLQDAPGDAETLAAWAHLDPKIAKAWTAEREAAGAWADLVEGAKRGIKVPDQALYRAHLKVGDPVAALKVGLSGRAIALHEVWDDAVRLDQLSLLRDLARSAARGDAIWLIDDEAALLALVADPQIAYTPSVVAYASARAFGSAAQIAATWPIEAAMLERLSVAPGSHDTAACVTAALAGLERLILDDIAQRSRPSYATAAERCIQHRRLVETFDRPDATQHLRQQLTEPCRRLPALRDELRKASVTL